MNTIPRIKRLISCLTYRANYLLIAYLILFLSGCTPRPAELPVAEARQIQSRVITGSTEDIARAAVIVLQDIHYTLDVVDMGLGLITAHQTSELSQATLNKTSGNEEISEELKTFCLVAGAVAAIGFILALIFGAFDDDEDKDNDEDDNKWRSRRSRGHVVHHTDYDPVYYGSEDHSYEYLMTIHFEDAGINQTRVRVTVQGNHYQGSELVESGPVEEDTFYSNFFLRLKTAMSTPLKP